VSESKDLLLSLARGKRRILAIEDHEALLLARWTVKTAFVLHTSANWRRVVPDDHIFKLDCESCRLPERVYVVGHTYKGSREFSWSQTKTWDFIARRSDGSQHDLDISKSTGYKIGFRLGGLFLMVFHNPLEFARPCLWKWRHIPLYPRWSHPVA
jgi:hypothetical protein